LCDEYPRRSFDEVLILGTICAWVLDPDADFCTGDSLRCVCRCAESLLLRVLPRHRS
jgi:hypothetical protein